MTTLLLTERGNRSYVTPRRIRTRERLGARLRARTLDTLLASGACPDSNAALSLRARHLISHATRRRLARAIHSTLWDAMRPAHPLNSRVPICRHTVIGARPTLEQLADHLLSGGPVDARGVAQVQILLSDASSLLYPGPQTDGLEQALQTAINALEPRL
jgi:hypothetical protein